MSAWPEAPINHMNNIPYILHQTWKNDNDGPFSNYVTSWKRVMPSLNRKFYADNDIDESVAQIVPHMFDEYMKFGFFIEKVDFFRYAILWKYGGIYADMDTECLLPIDELLKDKVIFPIYESAGRILVSQALMLSPPGQEIWHDIMEYIINNYSNEKYVPYNTGPDAISSFVKINKNNYSNVSFRKDLYNGPLVAHRVTKSWKTAEIIKYKSNCNSCGLLPQDCKCYKGDWMN